jgi:lipopolysaccharide transport system ATP-binding protein
LIDNAVVGIIIREINGEDDCTLSINSERDKQEIKIHPGKQEIQLQMPYCGLSPGIYTMKIYINKRPFYLYDMVDSFRFEVQRNKKMNQCKFYQPRNWSINQV